MPHLNNKQIQSKYKPNHQQTGLPLHSALSIRGKTNKKTNKQTNTYTHTHTHTHTKLSTKLTLYKAYTNNWTNLRKPEITRKEEFILKA